MSKKAIIVGAGPAGLTAAYELLKRTDIVPVIIEKSGYIGGKSKTISYSKSDRSIQPRSPHTTRVIIDPCSYHEPKPSLTADHKMRIIPRQTRIYFLGRVFSSPIGWNKELLRAMGLIKTISILCSFFGSRIHRSKPKRTLGEYIIQKLGKENPGTLQEVRNIGPAEQIHSPKQGAGVHWEDLADQILVMGGEIHLHQTAESFYTVEKEVCSIHAINTQTGELTLFSGDYFMSSMPVQELIAGMEGKVPENVKEAAAGLQYRDIISVGISLTSLPHAYAGGDSCVYIHDRSIKAGLLAIHDNGCSSVAGKPTRIWVSLQYPCHKHEALWSLGDRDLENLAITELDTMGMIRVEDVVSATVSRIEKSHPAYSINSDGIEQVRAFTDQFTNLFLIGRKGRHQCHDAECSVLTAMAAVDNISARETYKVFEKKKGKNRLGIVRVINTQKEKQAGRSEHI